MGGSTCHGALAAAPLLTAAGGDRRPTERTPLPASAPASSASSAAAALHLVCGSQRDGFSELFIVSPDGSGQAPLGSAPVGGSAGSRKIIRLNDRIGRYGGKSECPGPRGGSAAAW